MDGINPKASMKLELNTINGFNGVLFHIHLNFLEYVRQPCFNYLSILHFSCVDNILIEIMCNWENRNKNDRSLKRNYMKDM